MYHLFIPGETPSEGAMGVRHQMTVSPTDSAAYERRDRGERVRMDCRGPAVSSRRRDCHFADTPSTLLLIHLLKVEGV